MANPTIHTRCLVCEKEVIKGDRRAFHPPAINNCVAREFFTRFVKPSYVFPPNDDDSILLFVCRRPCFTKLEQGACRVTAVESIIRELSGSPNATLALSRLPAGGVNSEPQSQTRALSGSEESVRQRISESHSEIPLSGAKTTTSMSTSVAGTLTSACSVAASQAVPGPMQPPPVSSNHSRVRGTSSATSLLGKRRLHGGSGPRTILPKRLRVADPLIVFTPLLGPNAGVAIYPHPQAKEVSRMPGRDVALVADKPAPLGSLLQNGLHQLTAAATSLVPRALPLPPAQVSCPGPQAKEGGQMPGRASATAQRIPQGAVLQPSTTATASSRQSGADSAVLVTQIQGKSVRKFLVAAQYRRLVISLRYHKPGYTARTIMKTPQLRDAVVSEIAKSIQTECNALCAMLPEPSVLRIQSIDHLKAFHWDSIVGELKRKAPTLLAALTAAAQPCRRAKQQDLNTHAIAMAAAVLLKQRNPHLCLPQTIVGALLHSGHTAKKVFGRLRKLGVCVAYERMRHTVKALGISRDDPASGLKCEEKTPGWTLPCLSLLAGPSESATTGASDPAASPSSPSSSSVSSPLASGDEEQPEDDVADPSQEDTGDPFRSV